MEVITRTKDLRERIADILSPRSGRRVAIVAFVGADALRFAPEPVGLEVYCWPNKVATNPDGIRALLNNGAKVFFVDRLHIKAYWSSRGGCLIGSPNLSANALDETTSGLHEIGWYSDDASALDIDALVRRLQKAGAHPADEAALAKLEREYKPPAPDKAKSRSKGPTFNAYLTAPLPKRFHCVSWAKKDRNSRAEISAGREFYEEATGRPPRSANIIHDSILVRHGTKDCTWILACRIRSDYSLGTASWVYAHHVVKARTNAIYSTALQLHGVHVPEPPFDISSNDFHTRFGHYTWNALPEEFDERFDAEEFKRFEARRPR